jgi:hypothetical protein
VTIHVIFFAKWSHIVIHNNNYIYRWDPLISWIDLSQHRFWVDSFPYILKVEKLLKVELSRNEASDFPLSGLSIFKIYGKLSIQHSCKLQTECLSLANQRLLYKMPCYLLQRRECWLINKWWHGHLDVCPRDPSKSLNFN